MAKNIFVLMVALGLFGGLCEAAPRVVISDIDDTLKISHVLDPLESVENAFQIHLGFKGLPSVFRQLDQSQRPNFYYVTNAPASIMGFSHQAFLLLHGFPEGKLELRESFFDEGFKIKKIREILDLENPSEVLLIGDNGEQDPAVYHQLTIEYPRVHFTVLIHQIYFTSGADKGQSLFRSQRGWVSSSDLAAVLYQEGWMNKAQAVRVLAEQQELAKEVMIGNEPVYIPVWVDCRDHHEKLPEDLPIGWLVKRLSKRCLREPSRLGQLVESL